jgi:Zn-dependent M16 (insulinase) family peptidase
VSQPCLTTIGKPSASLSAKIEQDEKDRIAQRKADLGEDKLKAYQKALDAAKEESDRPPPEKMISDFPLTDVSEALTSLTIA